MSDGFVSIIKKSSGVHIDALRDDFVARRDKNFFWPNGTQVYVGRQGSGKTISAVKHMLDLKDRYPKCLLVSNIALTGFVPRRFATKSDLDLLLSDFDASTDYILFEDMDQLSLALVGINNGFFGVIYLIDEIHTYFNSLESKNIPMYVFTEISQQRKQRKLIVGTSQLFLRMAKPLREQCDNLVVCRTLFGFLTIQRAFDGMSLVQDYDGSLSGDHRRTGWFFQSRKYRSAFDTYQKVVSGAVQYEEIQRLEMRTVGKKLVVK